MNLPCILRTENSTPWAEELRVAISSILPLSTAVSPAPPPTGNFIVNLVVGSRAALLPAGLPGGSCRGWRSPPLLPVGGDRSGWSVLPVLGLLLLHESQFLKVGIPLLDVLLLNPEIGILRSIIQDSLK